MTSAKPLHFKFNKVDVFIRVHDGNRYLVLFVPEKYEPFYNRNRYLIGQKKWYYICFYS